MVRPMLTIILIVLLILLLAGGGFGLRGRRRRL
jgi:outer membrane lipopolysaccharide assembly protein LptE/RlpB